MSAALALAFVVASGGTVAAAPQLPDVAKLVREACVGTGMRRDAFERLVRERGWRRARTTSESGPPGGWNVLVNGDGATLTYAAVQDGRAVVSLSRQIVTEGPSPAPSSGVR